MLVEVWGMLEGQAGQLAMLARLAAEPERRSAQIEALLAKAHPWQRDLVAQGIADIAAMLDTGLAALATLSRREQDAAAPALVLWREFHAARAALLGVLQSGEAA